MRCQFGHDHPSEKVMVTTGNLTGQPRPFHCSQCPETQKTTRKDENWETLTVEEAQSPSLGASPAKCCF